MNKYKIALLVPYFGKFNNYFDLWISSCKFNKSIDWIIITDDKKEYKFPNNVYVKYCEFEELKNRIQDLYGFKISLDNPYKLCDFRVAYGEIFRDILLDYDYWGYCDTDLIWGDIRSFITDDILEEYDKICDAGHFTLYKNNELLKTIYKKENIDNCYSYKKVLSNAKSFAFDEWGNNKGINRIILENGFKLYYENSIFADIKVNTYGLRTTREDYGKALSIKNEKEKKYIAYQFIKGKLFQYYINKNNEVECNEELYVHFQKRPMSRNRVDEYSDEFIMIPKNKFVENKNINRKFLIENCKEKNIYFHYYKIRFNNLIKKLIN
ncbi:DUF6625 family protein [Clostridium perfringens]